MARAKPLQPRWDPAHPLARHTSAAWFFDSGGGETVRNRASRYGHGTLTGAGATWAASAEGRAVSLDGATGYVNCGTDSDVGAYSTARVSVWARIVLRTAKGTSAYGGVVAQWNDPVASNVAYQRFNLIQINGLGRPANSFEFTVNRSNDTYVSATLQFQASDVGRVVTLCGTYDGATAALVAVLPSGLAVASATGTALPIKNGPPTSTTWGRLDGNYLDMIALAGGIVARRAISTREVLDLHADPYGMVRPRPPAFVASSPATTVAPHGRKGLGGKGTQPTYRLGTRTPNTPTPGL